MYLHHLPASKKNVPLMLPDPIAVIKDIRQLVLDHKDDNPEFAISGKYVLRWTENDDVDHIKRSRKSIPKMTSNVNDIKRKSSTSTGNSMKNASTSVSTSSGGGSSSRPVPIEKLEKSPMKKGVGGNR